MIGAIGCSSNGNSPAGAAGSTSASGGSGNASAGNDSTGAGNTSNGSAGARPKPDTGPSSPYDNGMTKVGQIDAPATKLPPLPEMTHVIAYQNDDSASITFDPVDGAVDYRVYALPADGDITVSGDSVVIKDGTYRCAGTRETPQTNADDEPVVGGGAIHAMVDKQTVGGFKRTLANATIGYVYTDPGPGLVPVYALGESDPNGDSTCYFARWEASRAKIYTTSESQRKELLAKFFRDDGIVFYVPEAASDKTAVIYFDEVRPPPHFMDRWYVPEGPEADVHPNKVPAFNVLKSAAPGTQPLMRAFYGNQCGWSHDELAVGKERFNRIYHQGDKQPMFSLLWSGITKPTTLVVEALGAGCPFQGHVTPKAFPAFTVPFGDAPIVHQPWLTLDDARAKSTTGELFINGQFAAANKPKAIARAFINVAPVPHPKMDFLATFGPDSTPETFTEIPSCGTMNCYQTWRQQSPTFDQEFINAENAPGGGGAGYFAYGNVMGEWWVSYADTAGDTNGKYRLTANKKASISASKFLHVTMEADAYSTARRYPQILISDVDIPVQSNLEKGHTLVVQPRASINEKIDFPVSYELQICNLRTWDVNNQCPVYDLYHVLDDAGNIVRLQPNAEVGENSSADHRALFDVFASSSRVYLFLNGQPYACADLPEQGVPSGEVTVTWGDALYHSAVDHTFAFHTDHMLVEQRRHFDNLGFSSGVPAPTWDETRLPCAAPISLAEP